MSRKEIEVCIQSSKYKIAPRVPVGAFLSTVQFINGTKDSKACVLFLLDELLKIENQHSEQVLPTQEEVNSTTDVELHRFLHAIIKNDSGITKYYRAQKKHESMYCKFCKALIAQSTDLTSQIAPTMGAIGQSLRKMEETAQSSIGLIREGIIEFLTAFDKKIAKLAPLIDGTVVENGKDSFEKWANYGWTLIPYAPLKLFFTAPNSLQEADDLGFKYINAYATAFENEFPDLYVFLKENSEMKEAIFCFFHEQYRACAMLVIAILDGYIYKENREVNDSNERKGIAKRLTEITDRSKKKDKKEFLYLVYWNVYCFMKSLFMDADNFTREFAFINRNYLMHGMLSRDITRKDCIKLLLAFQNTLELLGKME